MRNVKFGVQVLQGVPDYATLKKVVLECERLGFDSISLYDHLQFVYGPTLECWTSLSALAEATQSIRIGPLVTCNAFRHPSLLAKMAATVDIISNGRLNFAIGAGFLKDEAQTFGLSFPDHGTRVDMLDEALLILRKLWTSDEFTYTGEYYSVNKAVCLPKPIQKPHPPILVGGGSIRMMDVIAKHANAWDVGLMSPLEMISAITRLRKVCDEQGRDPLEIENTFQSRIIIADTDAEAEERAEAWRVERNGKRSDPDWKFAIVGSPDTCARNLSEYVKAGVTYFNLLFADAQRLQPLRLFSSQVMQQFRPVGKISARPHPQTRKARKQD
jgi:alkanesulfonate monooxygenase SsuD/methylene tetrahydromethanopterin reductase-like flavin-dependent oxidoreductase (luciferase family)